MGNVVTAIFCQSAIEGAAKQKEVQMQKYEEHREMYSQQLREVFKDIDADESGDLSVEEFEIGLSNPRVQTFFESMELRIHEARVLFQLLQSGKGKKIEIDDFVDGCLQLRGDARNFDVALLRYECRYLSSNFAELKTSLEQWEFNTLLLSVDCRALQVQPFYGSGQAPQMPVERCKCS